MYQLLVILFVAILLSGCESLQREKFLEASSELWGRAEAAFKGIGQSETVPAPQNEFSSELTPLFEQPYIDPLTRYLNRYEGDEPRSDALIIVRQERDRRCSIIEDRYITKPMSQEALNLYRVGYRFSCPQDVSAYAERLEKIQAEANAKATTERAKDSESAISSTGTTSPGADEPAPDAVAEAAPSQQLSDCYLLTTIRNFSGASKACLQPAEAGDVQAQTNMAVIAHSLRDYAAAQHWALRAAPKSGVAAYLLGQMYTTGNGVEQDEEEANKWYEEAAGLGHAKAKATLAEHPDRVSDRETFN